MQQSAQGQVAVFAFHPASVPVGCSVGLDVVFCVEQGGVGTSSLSGDWGVMGISGPRSLSCCVGEIGGMIVVEPVGCDSVVSIFCLAQSSQNAAVSAGVLVRR